MSDISFLLDRPFQLPLINQIALQKFLQVFQHLCELINQPTKGKHLQKL